MTLYSSNPTTINAVVNDGPISLSTEFKVTENDCTLNGFRFYQGAATFNGTVTAALYLVGGTTPLTTAITVSTSGATGWREASLGTPYALTNGTKYRAVFLFTAHRPNAASGGMPSNLVNGPLTVFSHANATNGNHGYNYGASMTNPTTSVGSNYQVDVIVEKLVVATGTSPVGVGSSSSAALYSDTTTGTSPVGVGSSSRAVSVGEATGTSPVDVGSSSYAYNATAPTVTGESPVGVGSSSRAYDPTRVTGTSPVNVGSSSAASMFLIGSLWIPYPVSESGSQVLDFSYVPTSPEYPWPFPWEGDGYSNSLWLVFTGTDTHTLTLELDTTFDAGIEVWTGVPAEDVEEDVSILGYGQGTLEVPIAPGQRILMRAHPLEDTETGTGTLTWSVAARPETGVLGFVCQAQVLETPGWLQVSILSATPSSAVTFALDGGSTFFTVTTEEDGTFEGAVELPDLTVGAHTITATDVSGQTETEGFAVTLEVQPDDTIPGSTPPVTTPSPDPVIKWVLEDPMPDGLGEYTLPINPSQMSSPWPERQLRPERTIHGSGQDIVWEGWAEPVEWTVQGVVKTQGFYETLVAYQALNRRLYVIDHHQRAWIVAFDGLTFEKRGGPGFDDSWFHSYTAKFLILGGPVTLS